jgi:CheY-like chemotaxis protein
MLILRNKNGFLTKNNNKGGNEMEKVKIILVVEDEEGIRNLLNAALNPKYEVWLCANGATALSLIQEQCLIPHLILTDWQMPVMDGVELIKRVKTHLPDLPVIIMTGRPDLLPKENPADAVLPKPFFLKDLFETVEALI